MKAIFLYEYKRLARNQGAKLLFACYFLIVAYAITTGYLTINQQRNVAQVAWTQKQVADSTLTTDTAYHNNAGKAAFAYRLLSVMPENNLTPFSIGLRDLRLNYLVLRLTPWHIQTVVNSEITNPYKLLIGNIDLAFVLTYLMPLLVIFLGFDLLSAERESGILKILRIQTASLARLVWGRLLFHFLILSVLHLLILGVALLVFNSKVEIPAVTGWVVTLLVYIIFWLGVVACTAFFSFSTTFNAILLAFCWIALLVLFPSVSGQRSMVRKDVSEHSSLVHQARKQYHEWYEELPKGNTIFEFANRNQSNGFSTDTTREVSSKFFFAYTDLMYDSLARYEQQQALNEHGRTLFIPSPASMFQDQLSFYAHTDKNAYDQFIKHAKDQHTLVRKYFTRLIYTHNRFGKIELANIPILADNQLSIGSASIVRNSMNLLFQCVYALVGLFIILFFIEKNFKLSETDS